MSEKDFDQETLHHAGTASIGDAKTAGPECAPLGRIDHFDLLCELGGGGFGSVFLARDTVAGVDVAVKGLPPMVSNNQEELERIRENFALVSNLHHPNIAAALHLHPAKEVSYADEPTRQKLRVLQGDTLMVMAYAPGVTLTKWRKQFPEGKVPVEQALEVCSQVAGALDYAHREKFAHRDVKPSNIMVETREGSSKVLKCESSKVGETLNVQRSTPNAEVVVKVLDFGLAAEIRSSMSRVSQEKGDASGTRPYMAPEQWTGKKQDGRTDQYALAVLFYELVSGAVPFASVFETGDSVIMSNVVENKQPEPVQQLSKAQNAALLRALAKEPAQRFTDCTSFVDALGGRVTQGSSKVLKFGSSKVKGSKAWLWLAIAVVAVAMGYGTYRMYATYRAERERDRAASEQIAIRDAVQREKTAALEAAAEAALAAGDLEKAGARIAELDQLGGMRVRVSALRKRYESKAGERDTNKLSAAASMAREEAQKLDPGQGFGEKLKAMETTWREAEAARQSQDWGQALTGYDAVIASCKALIDTEVSREDAKTQRKKSEKAKADAEQAQSASDAADLYAAGERGCVRAAEAFEKGAFDVASKAWQEASASYSSAKTKTLALAVQGYTRAKGDFEAELGGPAASRVVLLEKHGAAKWASVKEKMLAGAASANDPTEGVKLYIDALAALPGAVKEAEGNEHTSKLGSVLAAARVAKAAGEWQLCIDRADEALALETGHAEAAALRREAEGNLTPTLTVVAEAGGKEVAAEISDGQRIYQAPHTLTLKPDASYLLTVSMKSSQSKRYKPATFDLTADWRGPRTRRVTLEEASALAEGDPWTSPATGMEFVWIPALKIWVGKYEVTNGEYRKKETAFDSKDYKGNSLNGDRQPVVYVNFDDAVAYAAWLTERDKAQLGDMRYRVISEAEWLVCAQCGDGREYPWGRSMPPKYGNYSDSAAKSALGFTVIQGYTDGHAVACDVEKSDKNDWGLYGIGGNVWEGCASDVSGSSFGAWRGASCGSYSPDYLLCAFRVADGGAKRYGTYGFRVVLSR
jgi:serine/threonine protein kinase